MANNIETYSGKSIAQQLLGDTKLGKWLWRNNTYTDGYDSEKKDASFKESANGQLVERMAKTTKDAGNLAMTGLAFGNPLTAGSIMSPLITASQAYWIANGINDGRQRIENLVEDPNLQDVTMLALDVAGAVPVVKTVTTTSKHLLPELERSLQNYKILGADGKLFHSKIPEKSENFYRVVTKEAIDDAKKSKIIRGNPRTGDGPYFMNTQNPQGRKIRASVNEKSVQDRYVIEGKPESAEQWVDSWRASSRRKHIEDQYHLTHDVLPEYHSDIERAFWKELYDTRIKDIRKPIIEDPKAIPYVNEHGPTMTEFGTEAFPMTGNKFEAPAKNFVYYRHFPVLGWRQFNFKDGGTIRKYQKPSGPIIEQQGENKTWNDQIDSWYEHIGISKPLASVNNKHQYDVTEYSGINADTVKMDNNTARQILNYPSTYLSRFPESDISVIQNELNKGAIIDDKFVNRPSAKDALKLIEDDYRKFQSQLEDKEEYKYDAPVDDSEFIKITAPNTNKAKYIFGHKISKNLINDIRVAAIERNQDPYDVLAHVLIEGGRRYNAPIRSHDYFNTHDLLQKQFPNKYLWQKFDKQSILKNLGIYRDDQNYKYTFDQIMNAGRKHDSERSKVLNNVIVPTSTADAVALHMQLHGRDFNPKQKGFTFSDGIDMTKMTVKHSYLDMIDDGIKSLKENMPDLFKKQGGKLKLPSEVK